MNIDEILAERKKTHGNFKDQARVSQRLKSTLVSEIKADAPYTATQREALEMICHKMARIVAGDPDFADHWRDIAGYATLVADELEAQNER